MQSLVLNVAGKPRATMKSFSKPRQNFHPFNAKEEREKHSLVPLARIIIKKKRKRRFQN